ncbi:MAG: copper transporter [Bacillota bacterium]|nr:copper transporter [Bacillota bacterium]
MIDFKYHITSLVAVFLALALGILIGSTMVGGDMLVERQKSLIDQIEDDFQFLREQNRLSQQELSHIQSSYTTYLSFAESILPLLVENRLSDKKIALINTCDKDTPAELLDSIVMAGGKIVFTAKVQNAEHIGLIVKALLEMEELEAMVLLGGHTQASYNDFKSRDLQIIEALERHPNNVNIIGVESSDSPKTYMNFYQKHGLTTTIDNIDTVIGRTALVYSLIGQGGHYGIKDTAQELLPSLIFQ